VGLTVFSPLFGLFLTHNLRGKYRSIKIKNREGERVEKEVKKRRKKGETAQQRDMIALKPPVLFRLPRLCG
jgi:hypothetical protein